MVLSLMRLVAAGQLAKLPQGAVAFRMFSSMRPDDLRGTNKGPNAWDQVLRSAQSSPEKLRDIVDTLWKHCKLTNTAPPLDSYNELLQICHTRHDHASIQKLVDLACDVQMHFNSTTHQRLQSSYNTGNWQYFFPPALHQPSSSSSSALSRGPAAAGLDAGASVHGGFVGFLPEDHAGQHQQQQQQVYEKHGSSGTHGGRMDD